MQNTQSSFAVNDLYPIGTPFDAIKSAQQFQNELIAKQQDSARLLQLQANEKLTWQKFIKSPIGIAILVFFFVLVIIYIANPPFTQSPKDSPLEEGSPSFVRAIVTSLLFAVMAFILPLIYRKLVHLEQQ